MIEKLKGITAPRLEALVDVATAGTIKAAAFARHNKADVDQSLIDRETKSISALVGELETAFDLKLKAKGQGLTADGKHFAVIAKRFLDAADKFISRGLSEIHIGGGDRLLHWVVLPKIAQIREALANHPKGIFKKPVLELHNYPDENVYKSLRELELDIAIVRYQTVLAKEDCSPNENFTSLDDQEICVLEYSFFVPRKLARSLPDDKRSDPATLMTVLPFADASDFSAKIEKASKDKNCPLKVNTQLVCENFPQACTAVASGNYCAVLPSSAANELRDPVFQCGPIPFLGEWKTNVHLMWDKDLREPGNRLDIIVSTFLKLLG